MTTFMTNFLKNVKNLKQEGDKLDRRKNAPVMVLMKLSKEEKNKLNIFNKKLDKFLNISVKKLV
jgi:hypothetical protein